MISLTAQAQPATTPLTLAAALDAAESRSRALQAQDASMQAFRDKAIAAGRLPDPVLGLSINNLPIEGPMRYSLNDDRMTMRSISLMQTFVDRDKRHARQARMAREADAVAAMRTMNLAQLRTQTARAWFERYFQQQLIDLLALQRQEALQIVAATDAAYRSGSSAQAEVFMARATVARIDDRLHQVRTDLHNAEISLARWIGEIAVQPLGAPPKLDTIRLNTDQLTQLPELGLLDAEERSALAAVALAREEKNADWTWSLMYSNRDDAFGDMLSFGVSIPLQWDQQNRQDRELAATLAKAEQIRAERDETRRELLAEVQRRLASWRSNLARLADYDQHLLPLAKQRAEAAQAAFRSGKGSLTAVLDAKRAEIDTRIERLRIEMQTAALWSELEFLIPDPPATYDATMNLSALPTEAQKP